MTTWIDTINSGYEFKISLDWLCYMLSSLIIINSFSRKGRGNGCSHGGLSVAGGGGGERDYASSLTSNSVATQGVFMDTGSYQYLVEHTSFLMGELITTWA